MSLISCVISSQGPGNRSDGNSIGRALAAPNKHVKSARLQWQAARSGLRGIDSMIAAPFPPSADARLHTLVFGSSSQELFARKRSVSEKLNVYLRSADGKGRSS